MLGGRGQPTDYVYVNGSLFEVRENLFSALKHIPNLPRKEEKDPLQGLAFIWVDAICINQAAVSERNHQVKLMSDIYSRATLVLAWMGVNPRGRCHENGSKSLLCEGTHERQTIPTAEDLTTSPEGENCFAENLHTNPYWKRLWIVQEVLIARHVIICSKNIWLDERDIASTSDFISDFMSPCHDEIAMYRLWQMRCWGLQKRSIDPLDNTRYPRLGEMCAYFSYRDCADVRDKVYGLLGVIDVKISQRVPVDYSLSSRDVYKSAVEAMLQEADFSHTMVPMTSKILATGMGLQPTQAWEIVETAMRNLEEPKRQIFLKNIERHRQEFDIYYNKILK